MIDTVSINMDHDCMLRLIFFPMNDSLGLTLPPKIYKCINTIRIIVHHDCHASKINKLKKTFNHGGVSYLMERRTWEGGS